MKKLLATRKRERSVSYLATVVEVSASRGCEWKHTTFRIESVNGMMPSLNKRQFMTDQMQAVCEKVIEILRRNDVKRASFFGSIVRGEMTEGSDVDILVEFEGKKSLLDLAHLKNELEDTINRRVDVQKPTNRSGPASKIGFLQSGS